MEIINKYEEVQTEFQQPLLPSSVNMPAYNEYGQDAASTFFESSLALGIKAGSSKMAYGGQRLYDNLFGGPDPLFNKVDFWNENFKGEEDNDELFFDFFNNIDSFQDAEFFLNKVTTQRIFDDSLEDNNFLSSMAMSFATDPTALFLALATGPLYAAKIGLGAKIALAGGEGAAYESLEHYVNPERSIEDSALSIGASTAFFGAVGFSIHKLSNRAGKRLDANDVLRGAADEVKLLNDPQALGAMQTKFDLTLDDMEIFSELDFMKAPTRKVLKAVSPRDTVFEVDGFEAKSLLWKMARPTAVSEGARRGLTVTTVDDAFRREQARFQNEFSLWMKDQAKVIQKQAVREGWAPKTNGLGRKIESDIFDTLVELTGVEDIDVSALIDKTTDPYQKKLLQTSQSYRRKWEVIADEAERMGIDFNRLTGHFGPMLLDKQAILDNPLIFKAALDAEIKPYANKLVNQAKNKLMTREQVLADLWQKSEHYGNASEEAAILVAKVESSGLDGVSVRKAVDEYKARSAEFAKKYDEVYEHYKALSQELDDMRINFSDTVVFTRTLREALFNRFVMQADDLSTSVFGAKQISGQIPRIYRQRISNMKNYTKRATGVNFLNKNVATMNTVYSRQYGLRKGFYETFGTTSIDDVFNDFKLKSAHKISSLDDAAIALKGGGNKKEVLDELVNKADDEVLGIVNNAKKQNDPDAYLSEAADKLRKGQKQAENLFADRIKRYEGTTHLDTFKRINQFDFIGLPQLLRFAKFALDTSSLALQVLSMSTELFASAYSFGIRKTLMPILKAHFMNVVSPSFRKLGTTHQKECGGAMNLALHSLLGDLYAETGSAGEQLMKGASFYERASKIFRTYNGSIFFDNWNRRTYIQVADPHIARMIEDGVNGKLSKRDIAQLSKNGLSQKEFATFHKYISQNRIDTGGGFTLTNLEDLPPSIATRWKDIVFAHLEDGMLQMREPDLHDFNLHPVVSVMMKFKQWPQMATQRYLISGMQHMDARTLSTWSFMLMVGMAVREMKAHVTGKDISDETFGGKIFGGLEQASFLGLPLDIAGTPIARALGVEGGSARYGSRGVMDAIVGPSVKLFKAADEVIDVGMAAIDPERDVGDAIKSMYHIKYAYPGNQFVNAIIDRDED